MTKLSNLIYPILFIIGYILAISILLFPLEEINADTILFIVFPYLALSIAIFGFIYRYKQERFSFSSQSSQFLSSDRLLFWGSVPWHYGITIILLVHLIAFTLVTEWGTLLSSTLIIVFFEVTGWVITLMVIVGLLLLIIRRIINPKVYVATTFVDWIMLLVLLIQVGSGGYIAFIGYMTDLGFGSQWFGNTVVPWMVSLVTLNPSTVSIAAFPLIIKLHMVNALILLAIFPFTRLVHVFTVPITYIWRPIQVVVWNRKIFVDEES
ncbi:MAG: Nitrate reductase-like protein NarX [Candidatus Heimdallarchaeota archaeon LC_3]|nr:MAG: Nitrate reductase-like protein NarX [Candidatus Heimdallarchaeota archaeon LC_3]